MTFSRPLSDIAAKPETIFHELYGWARFAYTHFPAVVLVLVSCLLVSVACCLFLICQFEYNKKKYVAWKSQPSSGYSTPTDLLNDPNAAAAACNADALPGTRISAGRTYVALEDVDTAVESIEDVRPLVAMSKRSRAEKRKQLRFCFKERRAEIAQSNSGGGRSQFRSLPSSPFLTRRNSPSSPSSSHCSRPVTAAQVKKALAVKSRRYQKGNFRPLRKPKGAPQPTPTSATRRHSRSLSDIFGLLSNDDSHSRQLVRRVPLPPAVPPQITPRVLPRRRANRTTAGVGPLRPASAILRPSSASTRSCTPRSFLGSRAGSRDTLKPTSSISEFSTQSGDPELEFDLYDYNLDNVAYNPGSHFAAPVAVNYWRHTADFDFDATPTAEEFTLTELFPHSENNNPSPPGGGIGGADTMLRSRTSDLTASVTSADLGTPVYAPMAGADDSSDCGSGVGYGAVETDMLLGRVASSKARPQILNLTHIDDEIDYADDDVVVFK